MRQRLAVERPLLGGFALARLDRQLGVDGGSDGELVVSTSRVRDFVEVPLMSLFAPSRNRCRQGRIGPPEPLGGRRGYANTRRVGVTSMGFGVLMGVRSPADEAGARIIRSG